MLRLIWLSKIRIVVKRELTHVIQEVPIEAEGPAEHSGKEQKENEQGNHSVVLDVHHLFNGVLDHWFVSSSFSTAMSVPSRCR